MHHYVWKPHTHHSKGFWNLLVERSSPTTAVRYPKSECHSYSIQVCVAYSVPSTYSRWKSSSLAAVLAVEQGETGSKIAWTRERLCTEGITLERWRCVSDLRPLPAHRLLHIYSLRLQQLQVQMAFPPLQSVFRCSQDKIVGSSFILPNISLRALSLKRLSSFDDVSSRSAEDTFFLRTTKGPPVI